MSAGKIKTKKKQLGNDQILGPDITDKLQADKQIRENMSMGTKTYNAIKKLKPQGKDFGPK